MRNGQNDQKTVNYVKDFFFIKLMKICKENQEWNVLYIRGYDVFKPDSELYNLITLWELIKPPQNFVQRSFHKVIKIMT